MHPYRLALCAALALAFSGIDRIAAAASPETTYTAIRVNNMHCATCAKKIATRLYRVAGVKEVRASVKKNTAYVLPTQSTTPSPRAMWEAVEAAGFKPLELNGPQGQFKSKPNA
ncbi:MAG: heavy-metal-associated domain-containing protein [Planctomycetales bacterium]|nr:heavy-metal-associated domain-containing protein [Planctomycetales bacterium]